MTRDQIIFTLEIAMPELAARFGVRHLMRCGSFARGAERPESDVDVLVEFDRQITLFGRSVDVGPLDAIRPEGREEILSEALRVA